MMEMFIGASRCFQVTFSFDGKQLLVYFCREGFGLAVFLFQVQTHALVEGKKKPILQRA